MQSGKNRQIILSYVFLLISGSLCGQAAKNFRMTPGGNLQADDMISGNQSLIINYSLPDLNLESVTSEYGSFFRIAVPEHASTSDPGKPELPVFCRLINIPEGADYKIRISDIHKTRINPAGKKITGFLYPAQEGITKDPAQKQPQFLMDKKIYSARGFISCDTVRIEPIGILRNKRIANLSIYPVRYDPHSNLLEVITSMKVEITFSDANNSMAKSASPGSLLFTEALPFTESLNKGVLNYNPDDVIPGYSDKPLKMVIITDSAFRKQLKPFIKWKTQKGFRIKVLYKGAGLAGNTYTQIKDTLTKIYKASSEADPPPEYLLIIGDVSRIPYYGNGNITDMYYGEFDGNGDYIPEMFIGRLPVADTTEVKNVVNKIIQYEKFQFADTNKFYSRSIVSAGNDATYANYMNGQVKYSISNYLTKENRINEFHFYCQPSNNFEGIRDSIIKIINKGASFINYSGHGDATSWLHLKFTADTSRFRNRNMYPFIISNACRTAQYSLANSLGNRMVVTGDKMAIGFIGCSNDSYWDEDFFWSVGPCTPSSEPTYQTTGMGAYDMLFHTHNEPASDWHFTMGQINYAGNLAVSASTSSRKKYYWETYNLVGDPSMIPITGTPDSFKIALPKILPNGIRSLSMNVDPFAYVAVSHFDTLWDASYASPSGSVFLDLPGLSNDSCLLVITGQNRIPLIKTIYFSKVSTEFLNLTSTSINDSLGNNNKKADFGEKIFLRLTLSNLGMTDATGLYAKISTGSNWLTIENDSVMIGVLPAGAQKILSGNFGIAVAGHVPDLGVATINLTIRDQATEKHYTIDVCIHAPELQIINCSIDDSAQGNGDFIADPGESFRLVFKVINKGSSDASGQFDITHASNTLTVLEPSVKSGILKFGEITTIPVMAKLSETASAGSYVTISSLLSCNAYNVIKDFNFRVGKIRESFETSNFKIFPWINISQVPWTITGASSFDGGFSARSGTIADKGTSSLIIRTMYEKSDSLRFYYRVSSEPDYDFLSFRLNGIEVFKKSGEVPWTMKSVAVPAGYNKLEWDYYKDNSKSSGYDCAWIDMIDFAGASPVSYIQKDLQVARIVTPVQKDRFGQGTLTVKLINLGKDTLNSFNLAYTINNHYPVIQQSFNNKVIPYGDSVTVSFRSMIDLSKYGIYKITAYGYDNRDDYLLNDTLRVTIENTELSDSLIIFPNPFNDIITLFISSSISDKIRISIYDLPGHLLYTTEKTILKGKNSIVLDDIRLQPSMYYLKIKGSVINKTVPVLKINQK
jgi:hypothetical protein